MRLIDADELRRRIIAFSTGSNTTYLTVENIVMMINKADTVDAVPVVRCKDCKYYKPDEFECGCDFAGGLPYVKADDFCSQGNRRDQSADVRNMGQFAGGGKTGGPNDADQH